MYAGLGVTIGSVSSPSVYFNGYTNTGFFAPGADQFGISCAGSLILQASATDVTVNGTVTATDFNSTSDINLKKDISEIENPLDLVEKLHGVKFTWKSDDRKTIGVIAQELEEVLPELVSNTDIKTVNYDGLIGVLIEAVKELKAEIEELKTKLNN